MGRYRLLVGRDTLRDRQGPSEPHTDPEQTVLTLRPRSQGRGGNVGLQAGSALGTHWVQKEEQSRSVGKQSRS